MNTTPDMLVVRSFNDSNIKITNYHYVGAKSHVEGGFEFDPGYRKIIKNEVDWIGSNSNLYLNLNSLIQVDGFKNTYHQGKLTKKYSSY